MMEADFSSLQRSISVSNSTGKERDAETGLDYFGARYYAPSTGRLLSVDPVYFQKEMMFDPQRYNLYTYANNNPLRWTDPTGERIRLMGQTERDRQEELDAIRQAVGAEAGSMLGIQQGDDGSYYVVINGDAAAFAATNAAAKDFGEIIGKNETANFNLVAGGEALNIQLPRGQTLSENGALGATGRDSSGQLWVYVVRERQSRFGYPSLSGSQTEQGYSWIGLPDGVRALEAAWRYLAGVPRTLGSQTGHEFGHGLWGMRNPANRDFGGKKSNDAALDLENKVREVQNPGGPIRVKHD